VSAAKSPPPEPGTDPGTDPVTDPVTDPRPEPNPSLLGAALRMGLRFAVVAVLAYGAHVLIGLAMDLSERLSGPEATAMQTAMLLSALMLYALLIAIPFVPGLEIGLALLLLRGASIAPAVYGATVAGLLLAFTIGRIVPEASIVRLLSDLRQRRAAALVSDYTGLSVPHRQARLEAHLPRWVAVPLIRYRYVCLAALLNLPGNVVFGGGGGLMLMAGLSRLYSPSKTVLTLTFAVLPVPLVIWWLGPGLLS